VPIDTTSGRVIVTLDVIESRISEKLMAHTCSGKGQVSEAYFAFSTNEKYIDYATFKIKLGVLLNIPINDEEAMALFKKYDTEGAGRLDVKAFIAKVFPSDFALRTEVANTHGSAVDKDVQEWEIRLDGAPSSPVTQGYVGHMPGKLQGYGRIPPYTSPPRSPSSLRGSQSPTPQMRSMGAYPCHVVDPPPAPLLSPKHLREGY